VNSIDFDSIEWHDAILLGVTMITGNQPQSSQVDISLSAYRAKDSPARIQLSVECLGVKRASLNADFSELADNRNAGNVANLYVKQLHGEGTVVLRLYLLDGMIEIVADSVSATERPAA
jgi:hypothetical protein